MTPGTSTPSSTPVSVERYRALSPTVRLRSGSVFSCEAVAMSARLVLRLRHETGMGLALWAANEAAKAQWVGYVDPDELPLTTELRSMLHRLASLTNLGWQRVVPGQEEPREGLEGRDDWRDPTSAEAA